MRYRLLLFNMYCDEFSPHPEFLEGKDWVERNSKFNISYRSVMDSSIKESEKSYNAEKDCYWVYPSNLNSDRRVKFPKNVNIHLLFWGHESRPCLGGGTFGGSHGLDNRPNIIIPYDVSWWSEPTDPKYEWDLSNQGAAVIVHELVNVIQCMIRDPPPYGLGYSDFPTYSDAPPGSSARDQHAWVLSEITDEIYEKIQGILIPERLRRISKVLSELIDGLRRLLGLSKDS